MSEHNTQIASAPATPIIRAPPNIGMVSTTSLDAEDLTPTQSRTVSPAFGIMPLKNALPLKLNSHGSLDLVTDTSHGTYLFL